MAAKLALLLLLLSMATLVSARLESQVAIVFLFVALFIGAFVTYMLSRYAPKMPYTVVVFAVGAGLSYLFQFLPDENVLKESVGMWNNMEPELLLFMFLPALLFGEAMSLNFHHVRGAIVPAALLAGPGALYGAFAMAAMAKFVLPYNWDWTLCLIFGVILCATDPVAVVALLKSAGASNKLTYLIIGEALMNDGTALVLYNLLYSLVRLDNPGVFTVLDVVVYFLRVIIISPLLGFAFGLGSVMCLSAANRRMQEEDTTIQMAITICCAYMTFFVAEYVLHVSGVLCCCAAAITLSRFAVPLILRPETIHSIWAAFEWIGNTLIFILAGLIIGSRSLQFLQPTDILNILVVYVAMFAIRASMMVLFFPALRNPALGKPSTVSDVMFATWGGLRGAVSMALALSLLHSTEQGETTISADDSHRVFFLVGGVAAMTLLINATTSGMVLKKLQLLDQGNTLETRIMFHYVKKRIRVKAMQLLEQLRKSRPSQINPYLVVRFCSILSEQDAAELVVENFPMQDLPGIGSGGGTGRGFNSGGFGSSGELYNALLSPSAAGGDDTPVGLGKKYVPPAPGPPRSSMSKLFESADEEPPSPGTPGSPGIKAMTDGRRDNPRFSFKRESKGSQQPGVPVLSPLGRPSAMSDAPAYLGEESPATPPPRKAFARPKPSRNFSILGLASDDSGLNLEAMGKDASAMTPLELLQIQTIIPMDQMGRSRSVSVAGGLGELDDDAEEMHHMPDSFQRPLVLNELLTHIRRAFLEVVRVSYWRQINSGKLPRKSSAALILLNSIDVALETTDTPGLQDWDVIETSHRALFASQTNYQDPIAAAASHMGDFHATNSSTAQTEDGKKTQKNRPL
mmetsp:Transcript_6728/g.14764  ORF Transcript_6728/g.14764 Transcript_6728/m.14764 type:complete len:857 (+) Transcript_6728:153-2723(+)